MAVIKVENECLCPEKKIEADIIFWSEHECYGPFLKYGKTMKINPTSNQAKCKRSTPDKERPKLSDRKSANWTAL